MTYLVEAGDIPDTATVERYEGKTVTKSDGFSFSWQEKYGPEPSVGDTIAMYGSWGRPIRGVAINGDIRWYISEEDWSAQAKKESELKRRKDRIAFAYKSDTPLIRRIKALPDIYRRRMEKFIGASDSFLREYGDYEMSATEDAVKVQKWLEENGATKENYKLLGDDWKLGESIGMSDGHSGNSYGMAVRLGWWGATDPEGVVLEHGAMVPLTGCEDYVCPHPYEEDE